MAKNGPDIDIDNEHDDGALTTLAGVTLRSFTTSAREILPFGSATLRWSVSGSAGGTFSVRLNGQPVQLQGTSTVSPEQRRIYGLTAHVGRFEKSLGSVIVDVNTNACQTFDIAIDPNIVAILTREINVSGRKLKHQPSVRVDPATRRVKIGMDIEIKVPNFRNPSVKVDSAFGIERGADDVVVAVSKSTKVEFDWPTEAWLIPGAAIALPLIESSNRAEIVAKMATAMDGFAQLADLLTAAPNGMRRRSLRVAEPTGDQSRNNARVETQHCPEPARTGPIFDGPIIVKPMPFPGTFKLSA